MFTIDRWILRPWPLVCRVSIGRFDEQIDSPIEVEIYDQDSHSEQTNHESQQAPNLATNTTDSNLHNKNLYNGILF